MAASQLAMYVQKFISCHCILMVEGGEDWKKNKIVQVWSSCLLLVWYLRMWKGHHGFHSQLCLGSFILLCKARRSQLKLKVNKLKYRSLVPRILDTGRGPDILPFLWYTERHWLSHPVSVPSFLLFIFSVHFACWHFCRRSNPPCWGG